MFDETEFMNMMDETTEIFLKNKGFDISTMEGLNAAEHYFKTTDPLISAFYSDMPDYLGGIDPNDEDTMHEAMEEMEMDRFMAEMRVGMMLEYIARKKAN